MSLWAAFGLENPNFLTYSLGQISKLNIGREDPSPRLAREALYESKSLKSWQEKAERLLVTTRVLELLGGGKASPDSLSTAAQSILALDTRKKSQLRLDELGRTDISKYLYRSDLQSISMSVVNEDTPRALLRLSALGPDQPWSEPTQEAFSETPTDRFKATGINLHIFSWKQDQTLNELLGDVCQNIETEKATRFIVTGDREKNALAKYIEFLSGKVSYMRGPYDLWQPEFKINEDFFTKNGYLKARHQRSPDPLDFQLFEKGDPASNGILRLPRREGGFDLLFLDNLERIRPLLQEFQEFSGALKTENYPSYTKALKSLAESYLSQDADGVVEYGYRGCDQTCKATPEASDILMRSVLHIKLQELSK